jgi:hypothetical protein
MRFPVVAISLVAAICFGSPAVASPTTEEQMVRGRGARDRSADGGGSSGGSTAARGGDTNRGGGDRDRGSTAASRPAERRADTDRGEDAQRRTASRDRDDERQRVAVPRDNGGGRIVSRPRDNRPVIVSRNRPDININIGNSYRGRYYAPVHYDRWARQYYRWSPIGYAPWSLIYGSIGLANFGYYGAIAPSTYYYGHNGYYGGSPYSGPWQSIDYDTGRVRLKMRPRHAEVYVDGHYAGLVDDFDGTFQSLRLPAGGHKIEIHLQGYEDLEIDVHVQPGRTLTLAEDLRPRP